MILQQKKLKEARNAAGFSLDDALERMKISRRRLWYIESNANQPTSDEIVEFARLYKGDVRELLLESYAEEVKSRFFVIDTSPYVGYTTSFLLRIKKMFSGLLSKELLD